MNIIEYEINDEVIDYLVKISDGDGLSKFETNFIKMIINNCC